MAMAGIIGIDLITIIIYLVIAAALVEVAIAPAVLAAVVRITTAKHLILNLFQVQIDLPVRQLLKSQEDKIIVEILVQ